MKKAGTKSVLYLFEDGSTLKTRPRGVHTRTLITVTQTRRDMVVDEIYRGNKLVKEMWAELYSFPGTKIQFDLSPPIIGDCIAIVKNRDGRVLKLTAPIRSSGVCC